MADEKVPTEIIEITSFEHYRDAFLTSVARMEAGESVNITLFDPKGYGPFPGQNSMWASGLTRAELEGGWPEPSVEASEKWKTIAKMAPASEYGQDGGLRPTATTDLLREHHAQFSAILPPTRTGRHRASERFQPLPSKTDN